MTHFIPSLHGKIPREQKPGVKPSNSFSSQILEKMERHLAIGERVALDHLLVVKALYRELQDSLDDSSLASHSQLILDLDSAANGSEEISVFLEKYGEAATPEERQKWANKINKYCEICRNLYSQVFRPEEIDAIKANFCILLDVENAEKQNEAYLQQLSVFPSVIVETIQ